MWRGSVRILRILSCCFLLGFTIGEVGRTAYEINSFYPYEWAGNPTIINCVGDELNEKYVLRAIDYWVIRGHNAESYIHEPDISLCELSDLHPGYIKLRKSRFLELKSSTLASTTREIYGFRIRSANISFKNKALDLPLVYIHELGHAYGYGHEDTVGHIMHSIYDYMGETFFIPDHA